MSDDPQLEDVRAQVKEAILTLRARAEAAEDEADKWRRAALTLEAERDSLRTELAEAKADRDKLQGWYDEGIKIGRHQGQCLTETEDELEECEAENARLREALEEARERLHQPIRPYGDKQFPMVPEHVFLREAYGEDLPDDLLAVLDAALKGGE